MIVEPTGGFSKISKRCIGTMQSRIRSFASTSGDAIDAIFSVFTILFLAPSNTSCGRSSLAAAAIFSASVLWKRLMGEAVYVVAPTAAGRIPAVLALVPRTGRKHQLRVHCAGALDAAIVGDYKYGYRDVSRTGGVADDWRRKLRDVDESTRRLGAGSSDGEVRGTGVPLHLHARCVEFTHPSSGERVRVVAPPPSHMSLACEALGLALAGGDDDGRLLDFNRR